MTTTRTELADNALGLAIELMVEHQIRTALSFWAGLSAGVALFILPSGLGLVTTFLVAGIIGAILLTFFLAVLVLVACVTVLLAHSKAKEQRS